MRRYLSWTLMGVILLGAMSAVAARRPNHGGALRLPTDSPIHSLDPINTMWPAETTLAGMIYDSPYSIDKMGRAKPHLLYPVKSNGGGKVLRFKVRQHAVFHDGTPVRAKHIVDSLERLARSRDSSWLLAMVEGPVTKRTGPAGIKLVGTNTIQFRLRSGRAVDLLVHALATEQAGIVSSSKGAARGIGTGPFVLRSRKGNDHILKANRDYFDGPPFLSEIRLLGSTSRDAHIRRFQLEKADASLLGDSVYGESPPIKQIAVAEGPVTQSVYLVFNMQRGLLRELPLRRGVDLALDRRRLSGTGARPLAFPSLRAPTRPEPSRARLLIRGLGISESSRPLVLLVEEADAFNVALAPAVQRDLAAVGLPVDRVVVSASEARNRLSTGNWDMRLITFVPVSSNEILRLGQVLALGQLHVEANRLVQRAPDATESELQRATKVLLSQLPLLPLCVRQPRLHYRTRLRGVAYNRLGRLSLADVWLRASSPQKSERRPRRPGVQ